MTATATSNPHEYAARLAKANKLVVLCQQWKIRSHEVAGFSEESWGKLADAARVKWPSQDTRDIVIQMLREFEKPRARR